MQRSTRPSLTTPRPRSASPSDSEPTAPDPAAEPIDVVVVSLAEARPPDLGVWQRLLRVHQRTLCALSLGDSTDAFDQLCESLSRRLGPLSRVVLVDPGGGEGIEGLAHLLDAWLAEWHEAAGHPALARPAALQTVMPDDLDANGLLSVMTQGPRLPDLPRPPAAPAVEVIGSPNPGVPVALLVVRPGRWTPAERELLAALQQALLPAPLLALAVPRPARDLPPWGSTLMTCVAPHTPVRVMARGLSDPAARLLAAELGVLAVDLDDRAAFDSGHLGRARFCLPDDTAAWPGAVRAALHHWPEAIAWHDERYFRDLNRWLRQALQGPRAAQRRQAFIEHLTQQLGEHLRASGTAGPGAPLALRLPMAGLTWLPPLPPRHITALTLELEGCEAVSLSLGRLPPGLLRLSACHGQLGYLTLDQQGLNPAICIELDHNRLSCVPLSLWALPPTATVSLVGNRLDARARSQLLAAQAWAGVETPRFVVDPPGLRRALQGWIDLLPGEAGSDDWLRTEARLGTPDFIAWIARLAQLPPRQRRTIRPNLVALIDACGHDEALCDTVLATVEGADARCDDRVVLVWERVRLALASALASRDAATAPAATLVATARRAFRAERLLAIAARKARAVEADLVALGGRLQDVEAVEIDLAYLSQLDSLLDLGSGMGFALHIDERVSRVSLREVRQAAREVQRAENAQFPRFLTEWAPWQQRLRHRRPEAMATLQEQRQDLGRIGAWTQAVQAEIDLASAAGLPLTVPERQQALIRGIAERERQWVFEQVQALTRAVLDDEGAGPLLDPCWPVD